MQRPKIIYPPIAPRRTASDCFAVERVSSGKGTPTKSKADPPIGISWNPNSIPMYKIKMKLIKSKVKYETS